MIIWPMSYANLEDFPRSLRLQSKSGYSLNNEPPEAFASPQPHVVVISHENYLKDMEIEYVDRSSTNNLINNDY